VRNRLMPPQCVRHSVERSGDRRVLDVLGGAQDAVANAIAIDDLNSVYVTGSTGGSFPTTPGSFQPNFGGGSADAFAARIDENAALGWATYLGGTDIDVGLGIAVDRERRSHVVGSTSSKDFPGFPFFQCCTYSFVLTLRADGSAVDWSFQPDTVSPGGVAVDEQGQTHIVGTDDKCDIDIIARCGLEFGVSVETFGPNGEFRAAIFIGDSPQSAASRDIGRAIATSGSSLWVTGVAYGVNFPATPGTFQSTAPGGVGDAFVVKIDGEAAEAPGPAGGASGGGGGSSKKCLIATAAFGSPFAREVVTLRRFRDRALLTHAPGRLLVRAYYRLSPPLARAVASQPLLAAGVRALLGPVAVGADFAMDRPAVATALAGVGLATIVGLAVMRGKNARRIRVAAVMCLLLGGVLLVVVFARGPRRTVSPSPAAPTAMGSSVKTQHAPGAPGTPAAPGRSQTAQAALDFTNLVGSRVSVTPLNPFASRDERRFAVTSELIEGILSAGGFVVTDPRRASVLGIEAGDTIVRINGFPPTGLVAAITMLQRDPDRAALVLEIDRGGTRIIQSHRVR
jgi:Beta-propeller repeat